MYHIFLMGLYTCARVSMHIWLQEDLKSAAAVFIMAFSPHVLCHTNITQKVTVCWLTLSITIDCRLVAFLQTHNNLVASYLFSLFSTSCLSCAISLLQWGQNQVLSSGRLNASGTSITWQLWVRLVGLPQLMWSCHVHVLESSMTRMWGGRESDKQVSLNYMFALTVIHVPTYLPDMTVEQHRREDWVPNNLCHSIAPSCLTHHYDCDNDSDFYWMSDAWMDKAHRRDILEGRARLNISHEGGEADMLHQDIIHNLRWVLDTLLYTPALWPHPLIARWT